MPASGGGPYKLPQGWIQSSSSDLHKSLKFFPNIIFQLVIALHKINSPSCFIFCYEIKQMRNHSVARIANPAPSERIRRVSVRTISSFVDTSENVKKYEGTTVQGFYREGGDWMYIDLFTNHSKPTSIGPNHSHCLANYSNSVMIGYLGRKLPCKLLTIIYTEEPFPLTFLCSYWVR